MINRPVEPDAQRPEFDIDRPVAEYVNVQPKVFISDTKNAALSAGEIRPFAFNVDCDGYLVYVVNDSANPDDMLLVSVYGQPGSETDDILTPGKGVTLLNEGNTVYVENTSTNAHTVIVKAFRNWIPSFFG